MTPTKRKVSFTFKREISLYNQERIYPLDCPSRSLRSKENSRHSKIGRTAWPAVLANRSAMRSR
jgi:hypothetical protein